MLITQAQRGEGKTTALIGQAYAMKATIVCHSVLTVKYIMKRAHNLKLPIKVPITYQQYVLNNRLEDKNIYLIDEIELYEGLHGSYREDVVGYSKTLPKTPDKVLELSETDVDDLTAWAEDLQETALLFTHPMYEDTYGEWSKVHNIGVAMEAIMKKGEV